MKYLVTGGAGFIGSNIVRKLLELGQQVRILDNFSTGKRENISDLMKNSNLELIEGDLRSFHIVRQSVMGIDYVLHQGALPSVPRSINDPITTNDINILGTLNILEAARDSGVKRIIYASSSSVYGNSPQLPKVEGMPVAPLSPYALSKYTGERYCQIYNDIYGLETVCLRYFNVFGPNQDPNSQYSAVIPKFIQLLMMNEQPLIYGDGKQSRDFTFVNNVVQANLKACNSENASGHVFNIACGESYDLIEMTDFMKKELQTEIEIKFTSERKGDVKHSRADITKAKEILDYKPEVTFFQGLKRLIDLMRPYI